MYVPFETDRHNQLVFSHGILATTSDDTFGFPDLPCELQKSNGEMFRYRHR